MTPHPPAAPAERPPPDSGVLRLQTAMRPEARYKALVEILPDVLIALFDRELRILALEGGASKHLEAPASAYIGKRPDEFLSPHLVEQIEPRYRAALRGDATTFDLDGDHGDTWWVQVIPIVDDAGNVCGGMAKWRDVSARVAVERELAEHARDLERSNAELEQFAYVASHDLSEPLRMITGYLELLERRYGATLDDDAHEFIAFAVDGAARMRALMDDLLAYSRTGVDEEPAEAVAVQELVEDTWRTLTSERDGPAPTLLATGLPTVMGFDAGQAERMFRVFQRLHTRDEYPGTGVGLAIARKVVERLGGRIWAEPRPGGGARFCFDLPAGPL